MPPAAPPVRIEDVVAQVPQWRGRVVTVAPLPGGMTNASYRVEVDGRPYVARIPGVATDLLGIDRRSERHNTEAAARAGVGPAVVAWLEELGVLVVEFLPGRTLTAADLRAPGMPTRLASSLRRLHGGPPFRGDFDMFRLIDRYLAVARDRDVPLPPRCPDRLPLISRIERTLAVHRAPTRPCHNDLVAENVLDDGRCLRLVDYEYSGNGDPAFELGNACQELGYDEGPMVELAAAYWGAASPAHLARIRLYMVVADVGWALWAGIQTAISGLGLDFDQYGRGRWDRAEAALDAPALGRWLDLAQSPP